MDSLWNLGFIGLCLLLAAAFSRAHGAEITHPSPWTAPSPCSSAPRPWSFDGLGQVGTLRFGTNDDGFIVANDVVGIAFAPAEQGSGLTSLYHLATQTEFVPAPTDAPTLWEIQVRKQDGSVATVANTGSPARSKSHVVDNRIEATLVWPSVEVPGAQGDLAVTVEVRLHADSGGPRLRIAVTNRLQDAGLWRVDFPFVTGLGYAGASDLGRPLRNHGILHRQLAEAKEGVYPAGWEWPMQYLSLTCGQATLYLACEDGKGWHKGYQIDPGQHFRFYALPAGMGTPGADYEQSYDTVLEPLRGDWFDAAQRYRGWALNQRWMRRGTVLERTDTPGDIKRVALWILEGGRADENVPKVLQAQEFFEVPLGVHWYNWHEIPFDHEYPHYFPAKPGFAEGIARLKQQGVLVMPYINGRLWDNTLDDFARARPFACKDIDGEAYTEIYGSSAPLSPMCPTQPFWHRTIADIVTRLKDESGITALYIDQIAASHPQPCFDAAHGHPLGGGHWWVDGYLAMVEKIRAITGLEVALTTENNCEIYADWFDAYLIWTPRKAEMAPIFPAVYGDRILRFGSPTRGGDDDTTFAIMVGRDFLWGAQLGWMGTELLKEEHRNKAAFLKRMAQLRAHEELQAFIAYGEMLRAPAWATPVPVVEADWAGTPVVMDGLERAAWRAPDGRVAVFVVNFDVEAQRCDLDLGGLIQAGDSYELVVRDRRDQQVGPTVDATQPTVSIQVPGRDGVALILQKN